MTSGADGDKLTTPNTVLVHEHDQATLPAAKKLKQENAVNAEAATSSPKPKRSFKAVANLVLAMKRFQAALNPQYEYGKQKSQMVSRVRTVRTPSPTHSTAAEEGAHSQDEEQYTYTDRGHKGSFLFKKLPEVPDEEQTN